MLTPSSKLPTLPKSSWISHAFISSRLDYCSFLLTGISTCSLHRLQMVQNSVSCLFTHTQLPVKQHVVFKVLLLTDKALHSLVPALTIWPPRFHTAPPESLIHLHSQRHATTIKSEELRGLNILSTPSPLWNSLRQPVRDSLSAPVFKSLLKTCILPYR